jgi:hypothetical protein
VQRQQLTFSVVEDVYFLMGLPFRGMALPTDPQLPRDVHLINLAQDYCRGVNLISSSVVHIDAMDALLHHCIMAMIVRIYGSSTTQRISGV